MSATNIIWFYILLGVSFLNSILFSDTQIIMNWVYALFPLVLAIVFLIMSEKTKNKSYYN